jgi:biofilm PGA synthesis N-glycosyltransferase PgaC
LRSTACCAAGRSATCSAALGVLAERDTRGYLGYLFAYQVLSSFASMRGYAQFVTGAARRWK